MYELLLIAIGVYLLSMALIIWFLISDDALEFHNCGHQLLFILFTFVMTIMPVVNTMVVIGYIKYLRAD